MIRRWQVLDPPAVAPRGTRVDPLDALVGDPKLTWTPAYSKVSGDLPSDVLETIPYRVSAAQVGLARGEVEVTTPGKVRLRLAPVPLAAWVDGRGFDPKAEVDLDLGAGLHALTFALPANPGAPGFRAEVQEAPGSAARRKRWWESERIRRGLQRQPSRWLAKCSLGFSH